MFNKNNKKIKIIGGTLAATIALTGTGLVACELYDSKVDHMHEECPFNKVLGVEHQINKINKQTKDTDMVASHVNVISVDNITDSIPAGKYTNAAGETTYSVPKGYVLEGSNAVKSTEEHIAAEYIIVDNNKYVDGDYVYADELGSNCSFIKIHNKR